MTTPATEIHNLATCHTADDVVVVVDVCRAFTTAAYAFAHGAERILLAGTIEEALALKQRFSGSLVMGEWEGKPVPEFDLWNSPAQFSGVDLAGRTLVQRTSAGTQGVVRATAARSLFTASLVVAGATAQSVRALNPRKVSFVATGWRVGGAGEMLGIEDIACAQYIGALVQGQPPDRNSATGWVETFIETRLDSKPTDLQRQFEADVAYCAEIDRFAFAMKVDREDDLLVMKSMPVKLME